MEERTNERTMYSEEMVRTEQSMIYVTDIPGSSCIPSGCEHRCRRHPQWLRVEFRMAVLVATSSSPLQERECTANSASRHNLGVGPNQPRRLVELGLPFEPKGRSP